MAVPSSGAARLTPMATQQNRSLSGGRTAVANDAFMRMIAEIEKQLREVQDEMLSRLAESIFQPTVMESVRDSFRARFAHYYFPA